MLIIVILVSALTGCVELAALCAAVWLLCALFGVEFNLGVTIACVCALNVVLLIKTLKEGSNDHE